MKTRQPGIDSCLPQRVEMVRQRIKVALTRVRTASRNYEFPIPWRGVILLHCFCMKVLRAREDHFKQLLRALGEILRVRGWPLRIELLDQFCGLLDSVGTHPNMINDL